MKRNFFNGQLAQDKWVLQMFGKRKRGYFLDIGASDGVTINNTYVLERQFGWTGICFEPGPQFDNLRQNRSALVSDQCLYSRSGDHVQFRVAIENNDYSGIDGHIRDHDLSRQKYQSISKETATLTDCLDKFNSPKVIDYMSLDTEGSEYEILEGLDFKKYSIAAITVEHNFEQLKRKKIQTLLENHGYQRVRMVEYDDWYILPRYFSVQRIAYQQLIQKLTYLRDGVRNRFT